MIYNAETAQRIAEYLLGIEAVKLRPDEPFTWASGLRSPIYCDNRKALSYPEIRDFIKNKLTEAARSLFGQTEAVAGVATAGIPQGALLADALKLPFVYVRSSEKSHGMTNRIEGVLQKGQKVLVLEDLVSTGKSSLAAVEALRNHGAEVTGMLAVFTYGLTVAQKNFSEADCKLVTLSDYDALLPVALEKGYISSAMLKTLQDWRRDPQAWSDNFR